MRRFQLAAITCLQGAVACSSYETSDNRVGDAGAGQDGAVIDTPLSTTDPTRTCVPKPPADWQGPLILFEGSGSPPPPPPSCPSGYRTDAIYDGNANLVAPDATCACECGPETGATCTAKLLVFAEKTCTTPCGAPSETVVSATSCSQVLPQGSCFGAKATATLTPGTCAPKMKEKTNPPTSWSSRARFCAPESTTESGCSPERIATPTSTLPFTSSTYCVAKTGENECPVTYPKKHVYYAAIADTRDCSCACTPGQGGTCSGTLTTSDSTTCTYPKTTPADGSCGEAAKAGYGFFTPATKPGKCMPESHPSGAATPTTPTTVCCTR